MFCSRCPGDDVFSLFLYVFLYMFHFILMINSSFWRALCLSRCWCGQIAEGRRTKGNDRSGLSWVEQENPRGFVCLSSFAHSLLFYATSKVWKKKVTLHFPLLLFGESIYQFVSPRFKYRCCVFPSFGYDELGHICSSSNLPLAQARGRTVPFLSLCTHGYTVYAKLFARTCR